MTRIRSTMQEHWRFAVVSTFPQICLSFCGSVLRRHTRHIKSQRCSVSPCVGDQKISPAIRAAGRTGRTQRFRCARPLWLAKDPDKRSIERSASMAGRCQERPAGRCPDRGCPDEHQGTCGRCDSTAGRPPRRPADKARVVHATQRDTGSTRLPAQPGSLVTPRTPLCRTRLTLAKWVPAH